RCPASAQVHLLLQGRKLVERASRWLMRHPAPIDIAATVARLTDGVRTVAELLPTILPPDGQQAHQSIADELADDGVPNNLAARVAAFEDLYSALDIVEVAVAGGHAIEAVAATYFTLDDQLLFRWLRNRVNSLPRVNRWQTLARLTLRD